MYYINACELLNTCIAEGVLDGKENEFVLVYRESGTPKEQFPEGWYKEPFNTIAEQVAEQSPISKLLERELIARGAKVQYTDMDQMHLDMKAMLDAFTEMANAGHLMG